MNHSTSQRSSYAEYFYWALRITDWLVEAFQNQPRLHPGTAKLDENVSVRSYIGLFPPQSLVIFGARRQGRAKSTLLLSMPRWMHVWEAYEPVACFGCSVLQFSSIRTKCTQSGWLLQTSIASCVAVSYHPKVAVQKWVEAWACQWAANVDIWSISPGFQVASSGDSSAMAAIWGYGFASLRKDGALQGQKPCSRFQVCSLDSLNQNTSVGTWKSTNMCAHLSSCPTFYSETFLRPWLRLATCMRAYGEAGDQSFLWLAWRNKVHFLLRPLCGTWPLQNWPNSSCAAIPFEILSIFSWIYFRRKFTRKKASTGSIHEPLALKPTMSSLEPETKCCFRSLARLSLQVGSSRAFWGAHHTLWKGRRLCVRVDTGIWNRKCKNHKML